MTKREFSGPPITRGPETYTPPEPKHEPRSRNKARALAKGAERNTTPPEMPYLTEMPNLAFSGRRAVIDRKSNMVRLTRTDHLRHGEDVTVDLHFSRDHLDLGRMENWSLQDRDYFNVGVQNADRALLNQMNDRRRKAGYPVIPVPDPPTPGPVGEPPSYPGFGGLGEKMVKAYQEDMINKIFELSPTEAPFLDALDHLSREKKKENDAKIAEFIEKYRKEKERRAKARPTDPRWSDPTTFKTYSRPGF